MKDDFDGYFELFVKTGNIIFYNIYKEKQNKLWTRNLMQFA